MAKRKNVLLILSDQQRLDTVSAYGMNVSASSMPLAAHPYAFPLLVGISLCISAATALIFRLFRR